MIAEICATVRPDRHVQLYAYTREESFGGESRCDNSVRSANHALEIVDRLCVKDESGQAIVRGRPPADCPPLWFIGIRVSNARKLHSCYQADYHKEPGCPNVAAEYMMEIYGAVKKVLRGARGAYRMARAQKGG